MKLGTEEFEKDSYPFYIAEIGSNHNGNIESAKKLILQAKQAGANAVKFQLWTMESLFAKEFYEGKPVLMKNIIHQSVSFDEFKELHKYAQSEDILCSASVFNKKQAEFLIKEMKAPFIKVASMSLNQPRFMHEIGELLKDNEVPIIISTGMSVINDIIDAIGIIEKYTKNIIILYCVSLYPPEKHDLRFKNIKFLKEIFPEYIIGYSDHDKGIAAPIMAVSKGANIIEKHFDFQYGGYDMPDAEISIGGIDFMQMKRICDKIFEYKSPEPFSYSITNKEIENRKKMRTSIFVTRDIKKGEIFKSSDFAFKRPGIYLEPKNMGCLIGHAAPRDFGNDTPFLNVDLIMIMDDVREEALK